RRVERRRGETVDLRVLDAAQLHAAHSLPAPELDRGSDELANDRRRLAEGTAVHTVGNRDEVRRSEETLAAHQRQDARDAPVAPDHDIARSVAVRALDGAAPSGEVEHASPRMVEDVAVPLGVVR